MATTYNLYRDSEKVAEGIEDTSYTDEDLEPNTDYQYQVGAVNDNGESELSEAITVHTDFSGPTGVSLDQDSLELNVEDNATLVASVSPSTADQTVNWSSSDEDVVTVDENGVVMAVSAGITTITATCNADHGINATCDITVNADDSEG